jgi:hypothetical protein
MTEQEIYHKAKKRVNAKKGFFVHFGVYLATVALLFTINYITFNESKIWWAFIPSVAWGIGIVAHYIIVFGVGIVSQFIASFGYEVPAQDNWEEKELEKEMKRLRDQKIAEEEKEIDSPNEELELKEIEKLRDEFNDNDFV